MPIYEFYCDACNMIFNFFSKSVNTTKKPTCPNCKTRRLSRQVSLFAVTRKAKGDDATAGLPIDEAKMGSAMEILAREAAGIDENDPRQAANLMRKLTDMTGIELGQNMREALLRMENGEDPDQVEAEMAGALEEEEPCVLPGKKGVASDSDRRPAPKRDEKLYDL
jgi:putative FmdB family regulatory protein